MSKIQFFTCPTATRFGGLSRQLPRVLIGVFSTFTTMAYAQTDTTASAVSTAALTDNGNDPQPAVTTLDTIIIRAEDASPQYAATQASSILKSDEKLFDSAKSVSVVTQNQLQQKQATTLADALKGVAGVTTGQYGRRGWDDIAIRGQLASSQILVDGMRTATSSNFLNSMDISGLESIEVVKGPDGVGFGQMMPGGVVNLTTKKPKDETFKNLTLSAGSNDFYQAAFDINYAPNGSTDGAFRLNGRVSDQNDPTDYVYFKNYYLAPSYRFALGDNTDVTLLASYQQHDYIRQQGLPLQNNAYKTYASSLFFGEPAYTVQDERYSLGYQLNHDFDSGWRLKQNFALSRRVADADAILASGTSPITTTGNIKRQLSLLDKQDTIVSMDNRFDKTFSHDNVSHAVSVGLDAFHERSDYQQQVYAYSPLNLNNPVYGVSKITNTTPTTDKHSVNYLQYLGLYAKDTIKVNSHWIIDLAGRHDWSDVKSNDVKKDTTVKNSNNAFTGSASLMYQINDKIAPYISYATAFLATTDAGKDGDLLDPEKGEQYEIGVKLQTPDERTQASLSYYDLTRKNVSESYTDGTETYNVAVGEQQTKGFEAELISAVNDNWNVSAGYSYIPTAKITQASNKSDYVVGQRINHIPKQAFNISTQYYFAPSHLGWYIGAGARYEGQHHAERGSSKVDLPSYTLYDVEAGYSTNHWQLGLSVKNLTDKAYYSGTSPNAAMIMFGEPRTLRANLTYKF